MAEDAGKKGKSRLPFYAGMAFASILTCGGGIWLGTKLTAPDAVPAEVPPPIAGIPDFNPATTQENPQLASQNTQRTKNPSPDHVELVAPVDATTDADAAAASDSGWTATSDGTEDRTGGSETRTSEPSTQQNVASRQAGPFAAANPVQMPVVGGEENNSDPLSNHIAMADDELRGGNYANALRIYQVAFEQIDGIGRAAVLYRMGLCGEASGNYHDAANRYQQITRAFSSTPWAAVGRLGEARCLAAQGRIDTLSAGTMRPVLLDRTVFSPEIRGELMHVCGRAFCRAFLPEGAPPLLEDTGLIMPPWLTDPNRELDLLPRLLAGQPLEAGTTAFEVLQQTDRLPGSTYLKAISPSAEVELLLAAVCERSGFEFRMSDSAKAALRGRTQRLQCEDTNLSLILDGLTIPFGLIWWHDDEGVHVLATAEAEHAAVVSFQRRFGIRLLQNALVNSPDSQQASFSRLALGVLQFQNGTPVEAAYTFQSQMEIDPRSHVESEAAFNLGKCYLASAQLPDARDAFLLAVDASLHNPNTAVVAYLYVGRMQIEEGHFQSGVSSMVRALAMCRGTDLEPHAALLLASAYLMAESPEGATSVLMERREEFESHRGRNAGAFLSSLSRFQRAVLPGPRERAGRSLVTALTRFRPQHQFGSHWIYLHARACEDLGLIPQAIQGYTETIKHLPAAPLRQQAMVRLAAQFRFERRLDEAALLLAGIEGAPDSRLGQQISMQAALVALDKGDGVSAVRHCRRVIKSTEDEAVQRAALQVMGKAYEMANDHKAAIYCFAGMLPHETGQQLRPDSNEAGTPKTDASSMRSPATGLRPAVHHKLSRPVALTPPTAADTLVPIGDTNRRVTDRQIRPAGFQWNSAAASAADWRSK